MPESYPFNFALTLSGDSYLRFPLIVTYCCITDKTYLRPSRYLFAIRIAE